MWKYNKGEWSEIYAFAYILSSGNLWAADKDLNKLEKIYFPVLKVIREEEKGEPIEYNTGDKIRIFKNDVLLKEINKEEFDKIVNELKEEIPKGTRAFPIPIAEEFFQNIHCKKVKASPAKKEDITLQLHDIYTGISPVCGFSIKSFLGADPTLVNAGVNTNFEFTVDNCTDDLMEKVNNINTGKKLIDRMNFLIENGCVLHPVLHSISKQFEENLQFIDSMMPSFLQYAVLYSYLYGVKSSSDVVKKMVEFNPLNFSNGYMYSYKYKKMLTAFALGLTPERENWLGVEDANGGYITVKKDGDVVCYYLYNRSDFEQYLYDYTVFDRPSSSKHHYCSIYKENGLYKIKLCLQIRFR